MPKKLSILQKVDIFQQVVSIISKKYSNFNKFDFITIFHKIISLKFDCIVTLINKDDVKEREIHIDAEEEEEEKEEYVLTQHVTLINKNSETVLN